MRGLEAGRSRMVFDTAVPVRITDSKVLQASQGKSYLAITIVPLHAPPVTAVAPASLPPQKAPSLMPSFTPEPVPAHLLARTGFAEIPVPVFKPGAPESKPLIVIDAGHGGEDPGTIGETGTREKDVTLRYAYALRYALLKTGRYEVAITREDDRFIMLRDRFRMARKVKGALFISLHADSAPTHAARGLSVYTLSEKASDEESAKLAEQENKSDVIAGMDLSTESEDVASILIDLAQRETMNKSTRLADILVAQLGKRVGLLPNPHRYAGFAVLKAPDIPSVLIEIGFLSHPKEEKLINSKHHLEEVVDGLVAGIDGYFRK